MVAVTNGLTASSVPSGSCKRCNINNRALPFSFCLLIKDASSNDKRLLSSNAFRRSSVDSELIRLLQCCLSHCLLSSPKIIYVNKNK